VASWGPLEGLLGASWGLSRPPGGLRASSGGLFWGLPGGFGGGGGAFQSLPSPAELDRIVKLETLLPKPAVQVADVWSKYHEDESKGRVGSTLSASHFSRLAANAKESPIFLLPVPKPGGFLSLLVQCQLPRLLVTTVEEYRRSPIDAVSHLTLTYYTELSTSKGLVLVRGDLLTRDHLDPFEAKAVVKQIHHYYTDPKAYRNQVWKFNHNTAAWSFTDFLNELGYKSG